jgi:small subunit ribosomal protein S4
MRYTGPKNRLARREGIDLNLKTPGTKTHSNLLKRINILPGQHGAGRQKKLTDYGIQLREKQKLKRVYSVTEKQMSNYFEAASKTLGNTAEFLSAHLERRLDNVVYRLGFAPTRASARQLVGHGHMTVNGKVVSIPSFAVKVGDVITFKKDTSAKIPYIAQSLEKKDLVLPSWLEKKATSGKVTNKPEHSDIKDEINLQLVVEFYSR